MSRVGIYQRIEFAPEEIVMKINEMLLAQFEREAPGTRKALERVPEGKNDWKPHPKSMPLGSLAVLVASMPSWTAMIIDQDDLDLASGTGGHGPVKTNRELLQVFDKSMEAARQSLSKVDEDRLMKSWRLLYGGKGVDDRPRPFV